MCDICNEILKSPMITIYNTCSEFSSKRISMFLKLCCCLKHEGRHLPAFPPSRNGWAIVIKKEQTWKLLLSLMFDNYKAPYTSDTWCSLFFNLDITSTDIVQHLLIISISMLWVQHWDWDGLYIYVLFNWWLDWVDLPPWLDIE